MAALTALETLVPEDARASLIQAAQTLTQIDQQALMACPTCGPSLITEIPSFTNVALDRPARVRSPRPLFTATPAKPAKQNEPRRQTGQGDDGRDVPRGRHHAEGPTGKPRQGRPTRTA